MNPSIEKTIQTFPKIDIESNESQIAHLLGDETEKLLYAFTDSKNGKCNKFYFTSYHLIILDRVPEVDFKMSNTILTGWKEPFVLPYFLLSNHIELRQFGFLWIKYDLSVLLSAELSAEHSAEDNFQYEFYLSKKDTKKFRVLVNLMKDEWC